ncbi:hypothetical protein C2G38_2032013 [Gigaspora rosea]|uniref:Uncharacterized protein n=1 Tax=Gigaspora rosea TaxID=44941 RepID=A0A397VP79_9GLOM|nr:hypothetical protein C2G38_2032013 [Gigaspora rosea]CAG8552331.1 24492_t:CDS:1 [Gigaspora rosea]
MTDINRLAYYVANSGLLRQNYDANNLARSCQCVYELTGFKALNLVVIPECHRNNIRSPRIIKQITMCIWDNYTTRNDKEYFINLASQINQLLANQRSHRTIRRRPRRMPESYMEDMEHTPFSLTLFYGTM